MITLIIYSIFSYIVMLIFVGGSITLNENSLTKSILYIISPISLPIILGFILIKLFDNI